MNNNLHAHVSTSSADCDGPQYNSFVEVFNDEEVAESMKEVNDFSEITFMNRVLTNRCSPYAVHQMRVTMDDEGFEWHEDTEEGYRAGEVKWCRDDCDTDERHHRDVFAESMNY